MAALGMQVLASRQPPAASLGANVSTYNAIHFF
jgi:hypothetical protein